MNLKSFVIGLSFACTLIGFGCGYWTGLSKANSSLMEQNQALQRINLKQARLLQQRG